ncbi:hypothetical protein M9H77_16270 [Catharanthus roseus]|uniref:Uncharacterized protein n=1 Tax=Catharanthus roseus TaxID=4058 RepID=A0ACC0B1B1_CATRO|nr:hypothetical protein M9H77_16270 [Catharanthus roseus]
MRQIAYGAYGPYFTGVVQKAWTLPTNRMISHAQLVRKILKYRNMDPNLWSIRMTMRVPSFSEEHLFNEPSMLYTTVIDDNAEIDHSDEEYVASSQSESDNEAEEEDLQTPVIHVAENTVTQ